MSETNPKVDFYFTKAKKWQKEIDLLRTIVLDSGLTEELKWGVPCYTLDGNNVVLIHTFKDYCALLFHKGVLIKDVKAVLIQQTENVQAARQMRFTDLREIIDLKTTIKTYIKEAIKIEKSGEKVPMKETREFKMPEEFKSRLEKNAGLKKAFETLTPGRQRGYLLYFSSAKQSSTRESRIEKYIPQILKGKGVDD
ncbi:hypothetical protein CNR22_03545 [Sphingobacteriaceae bacterium]|nr:hypothetical protein CNR22_03545 [Sphingobacteriaceae bacterium]